MTAFDLVVFVVQNLMVISLLGMMAVGVGYLSLPALYVLQRIRNEPDSAAQVIPASSPQELPEVLVQLPVFNEPNVVEQLLEAVAALDWPRDKLHIQLLDDSSDHTVEIAREKIAELTRSGFRVDHICRDHRDGFKAEALAAGLARSSAQFIAVLDADFRPPADWLRVVVPRLLAAPRAGFIQSRCQFANADTNWLTRAQGLLFDTHFIMEQAVRARAGLLFQFNGTAAVWRRCAIEAAGGWSGDSLCEDLDLTIRAALAGWHGLFAMDPVVSGLVPDRIEHWRVQQRRWAMGFAQIARKLMALIWMSDWSAAERISAGFLLLYQACLPITVFAIAAGAIDTALNGGRLPFGSPLIGIVASLIPIIVVSMTLPPYLELKRGSLAGYFRTVIALPPLIIYLAFCNVEPMLAAFFGRNDAFHRTPKEERTSLREEPASL